MKNNKNIIRLIIEERAISLFILILLTVLIAGIFYTETFFTANNFLNIIRNSSFEGIIAVGMTIALIFGGIDLSVGAVSLFTGVLTGYFIEIINLNIPLSILLGLLAAAAVGLFNGVIIAKIGVTPFISTLATLGIIQGLGVLIGGTGITNFPKTFQNIANFKLFSIYLPAWYLVALIALFTYLFSKNRFFRSYYFIGGNEKSAVLSGINVVRVKIIGYIIISVLAGFTGILFAARLNMAYSYSNTAVVLRVITAVVLGGCSLSGGKGNFVGSILGIIFMNMVNNVLVMGHIPDPWVDVVLGMILVFAVSIDMLLRKRFLVKEIMV